MDKVEIISKPIQTLNVSFFDTDGIVRDIIIEKYNKLVEENKKLRADLEMSKKLLESSQSRYKQLQRNK